MVQGGGAAEAIFTSGFEYVFGLLNPASDYFNSILEWGTGIEPGPNTVAIVSADDVFSLSAAEGAEQYAGELGYDVISLATFEEEGDLPGILGNLTDDDPDMVLFSAHFGEALSFVQAAKDVGLSPDMFGITVAPSDPAFVDELGADADYVFGTSQWLPVLSYNGSVFESAEGYALLYQQEYGREPDYHSAAASACGVSYQLALEEAGSLDRDDVRDALGALDAETFYGRINFGADGRIANCPMVALQIQDGNIVIIFPESLATGSALYPTPGDGTP
jgi:branched-chain amino acid transport system substrate-binding protein